MTIYCCIIYTHVRVYVWLQIYAMIKRKKKQVKINQALFLLSQANIYKIIIHFNYIKHFVDGSKY